MFRCLTLIGIIFVGSIFAAADAESADLIDLESLEAKLQKTHKAVINAATFETISVQAAMVAEDAARIPFDEDLVVRYNSMEQGLSALLELHSIRTKAEATDACAYYQSTVTTLSDLVQKLTRQLDALYTIED